MGRRQIREDAKNLTLIGASAIAAVLATVGFMAARSVPTIPVPPPRPAPAVAVRAEPVTFRVAPAAPMSGADRIYGRALTVDGRTFEGFIRWDRNEGSWTDVLDADKVEGGRETQSGIRFGQIHSIRVEGSRHALLTLRSGEQVELSARATDLGRGLRAFVIGNPQRGETTLDWSDLDVVEFLPVPEGDRPGEGRLYGTLTTRSGERFTGRIAWDVDEIYTTDVLDGDRDGRRLKIPFGAIERIERSSSRAAHVVLTTGEAFDLSGTNDVNDDNGGVSVSDPSLGQVKVSWDELESVVFEEPTADADRVRFDGGAPLRGSVLTESGQRLTGVIRWDDDEASSWEMLNGDGYGADFQIEFAQIDRIEKSGRGARVTLRDGRSFELSGSNDVDSGNRGIFVDTGDTVRKVRWEDFRELQLTG